MKASRILLALALPASLAGVAYVAQQTAPPGAKMAVAAEDWLQSLNADQKARATFPFDSKERTNWKFTPQQDKDRKPTRKGLALEAMTAEQKKAAVGLVRAGTSAAGAEKALTIMSLEAILRELEAPKGG